MLQLDQLDATSEVRIKRALPTMLKRGLIVSSNRIDYALSEYGRQVAASLAPEHSDTLATPAPRATHRSSASDATVPLAFVAPDATTPDPVATTPATLHDTQPLDRRYRYRVMLLVDHREVASRSTAGRVGRGGVSRDALRQLIEQEHSHAGLSAEAADLPVGDFLWIARPLDRDLHSDGDIVLDHIIERKTVKDLCASIVDGRYREQRFRLSKSNVRSIAYLIEGVANATAFRAASHRSPITLETFQSALASLQVSGGFRIYRTDDMHQTAAQLGTPREDARSLVRSLVHSCVCLYDAAVRISRLLAEQYSNCSQRLSQSHERLDVFRSRLSKSGNLTVSEVFAKQLMQIPGCSAIRAAAIVSAYPTPLLLVEALEQEKLRLRGPTASSSTSSNDSSTRTQARGSTLLPQPSLIASLVSSDQRSRVGPAVGDRVTRVFLKTSAASRC